MLRDKTAYDCKCQEYVRLYATATALEAVEAEDKGATQGGDGVEENPHPSRQQAGSRSQPMRMAAGSCCSTISSSTTSCQSPTALTPVIRGRETGQDPASDASAPFGAEPQSCGQVPLGGSVEALRLASLHR
ncbi:Ubiquitin-conjugating enzyme E2 H [Perkinsus olseni]|uniref:Ubiquitin-conjugating enzyme E2 H n=1 Tax=Perkinsus olseni TaxID=32597 RepID=A0A7J6NXZ4_PEROL|nr:Ubiquitin-conjugating enzyme E2 H [Perkinsus olseni]